jgi:hypothetical protein
VTSSSQSVVTTEENATELVFVVEHETGWIELLAVPLLIVGTGFLAWRDRFWLLVAICAAGLIWMAVGLFRNRSTRSTSKLVVNGQELLATPNLIAHPNRVLRFKPYDLKFLGYLVGGDNERSGLYLNQTCVFDGLDRKQAEAIAFRIFQKFPNIVCDDKTPASLLHGDDSGITSLGLSASPIPRNP